MFLVRVRGLAHAYLNELVRVLEDEDDFPLGGDVIHQSGIPVGEIAAEMLGGIRLESSPACQNDGMRRCFHLEFR